MDLQKLSDSELHESAIRAAKRDREAELETIAHLREVERRRLHSARGFPSLFAYAVEALGFSESAAATRIQAMRLARSVPAALGMLQSGELSVTTAAMVQRFFRQEAREPTLDVVREVAGKSRRETERLLLGHAREPVEPRETERVVSPTRTELSFSADSELMALLNRYRELKGSQRLDEILKTLLAAQLERIDPLRKSDKANAVTVPEKRDSRYVAMPIVRELHRRSGSRCEFIDAATGRRCASRFRLQADHIEAFARGGPTRLENLRLLCGPDNRFEAIRTFGETKMAPFLATRPWGLMPRPESEPGQ
jgi:hypothetical protein